MAQAPRKAAVQKEEVATDETIIAIANEMNEVLGLNPPIDTALGEADLLAKIKLEASSIGMADDKFAPKVYEADKSAFAPETWDFFETNGMLDHVAAGLEAGKPAATKPAATKAAPAAAAANPLFPTYKKMDALADAIKAGGGTIDKLAVAAAKLSVDNGGKDISASIKDDIKWVIQLLTLTGPIELTKDGAIVPAK